MAITLTIEKSPPGGAPVGASRPFDKARVTLGRGQCDWVLPGDSTLSRIHCQIVCENGIFEVIDTSQAGVFMNGAPEPLGPDNRAPLSDGDLLTFGSEYNLRVDLPAQSRNPFLPDMGADTNTEALSPFARIPEFQPFPPPEAKPDYLNDPALPMRDDAPPETLDIGRMGRRIIPDDWDGAGAVTRSSSPPPPSSTPRPSSSPGADDAFAAFIGGAGLKGQVVPDGDPVARLKEAGKTYRAAVDGILEILKARSQFKEHLRIERTQINPSGNNPLKFCLDTEQALLTMIGGNRPGYMLAREAVHEALKDVMAHDMALVAAVQVALQQLLAQIDPEALKRRLEKSWVDGLAPGVRKARMWEIYQAVHAQMARDLADDFDRAFGSAFAEAYEQYVRK